MGHQSVILGGGLANYEDGLEVDPELVLQESDREEEFTTSTTTFPRPFDRDTWEKWTLRSGLVISQELKAVARMRGHPLR